MTRSLTRPTSRSRLMRAAHLAPALLFLAQQSAWAATITVSGGCSLVDAITAANTDTAVGSCTAGSGADTVELTGDVTLTAVDNTTAGPTGLPSVTSDVTVQGNGHTLERSSAGGTPGFRLFHVASSGTLAIDDLRIENGNCSLYGSTCAGGGLFNEGDLSLVNTRVSMNSGFAGGGIDNTGTATLVRSEVSTNSAQAAYSVLGHEGAGGIRNSGSLTLVNTTISENLAFGGPPDGQAILAGGIVSVFTGVSLTNSTIVGNTNGPWYPCALPDWCVDGVFIGSGSVANSIIADECGSSPSDSGNNFGHTSCGAGFAAITPGVDFDESLSDNSGPTRTHALLPSSVAIDAAGTCGLATDQRGAIRMAGACDSGAYEAVAFGCGNGLLEAGEECDDGNTSPGDGCGATCLIETPCANGIIDPLEECDDGNTTSLDGCSDVCDLEAGWICSGEPSSCVQSCGDGSIDAGEQCDDGPVNLDGDGCSANCEAETGWSCSGEPSVCTEVCGDGILTDEIEECDDACLTGTPNVCEPADDGDGCSQTCTVEPGWVCTGEPSTCVFSCGDGALDAGEQCDDGGTTAGDGCSANCEIEPGWRCDGEPSSCAEECGNGAIEAGEACDDGSQCGDGSFCTSDTDCIGIGFGFCLPRIGDGCSDTCQIDAGWTCAGAPSVCLAVCGDGIFTNTVEQCDDGCLAGTPNVCEVVDDGDGCESDCTLTPKSAIEPSAGPGTTVTTDTEADGATPSDPLEATVTTPTGGSVSITRRPSAGAPTENFVWFGQEIDITAPSETTADPLVLTFRVDISQVPSGFVGLVEVVKLFKDGALVPDCAAIPPRTAGEALPDPCVVSRTLLPDTDWEIQVLSSTASTWNVGMACDDENPELRCPGIVVDSLNDTVDVAPTTTVAQLRIDPGPDEVVTLREAILAAENTPGADLIRFDDLPPTGGTLTLDHPDGELGVSDDLTIRGPGTDLLSISGNKDGVNPSRVFGITGGEVTIEGLAIENGEDPSGNGGGIEIGASASVKLIDCRVNNHESTSGLAGAIMMDPGSELRIERCTVENNVVSGCPGVAGGGAIVTQGDLAIIDSTIAGNQTTCFGGGILVFAGSTTLEGSTLSGNAASTGTALHNDGGLVSLTNTTVSNNGSGSGTLRNANSGTMTLTNATVASNPASPALDNASGSVSVSNSLLANSASASNCGGSITDSGNNFADDGSCGGFGSIALGVDLAGSLGDNGGPTLTHDLLVGSAALGAAGSCGLATGQRGVPRPQGTNCDSGAVEFLTPGMTVSVGPGGPTPLCTLADAITAAQDDFLAGYCLASSGSETVQLTGDVVLANVDNTTGGANGLPSVSTVITIEGGGNRISRDDSETTPQFRLFHVELGGTLAINDTTVANGSSTGYGGNIQNDGSLTLTRTTLSGGYAPYGGGLGNSSLATITNSTLSGNSAKFGGGAIHNYDGIVWLTNTTIAQNSGDPAYPYGVLYNNPGGSVQASGNIVAASTDAADCSGVIADFSGNFSEDGTCGAGFAPIAPGVDFDTTLADNGGPTRTHALLAGSVAIDAAAACGLSTDQRGVGRPQGAACDSGAFEFACGNTVVDLGEQCDYGDTEAGDCCSPTCQYEAAGQGMPDCCSMGVCQTGADCGPFCFGAGECQLGGVSGTQCICGPAP